MTTHHPWTQALLLWLVLLLGCVLCGPLSASSSQGPTRTLGNAQSRTPSAGIDPDSDRAAEASGFESKTSGCAGTSSERDVLRLEVVDRSELFDAKSPKADRPEPRLCLANSAESWKADSRCADTPYGPLGGEQPLGWVFSLPRALVERPGFEFKFTRGSWETVEVDAAGEDLANRRLGALEWPSGRGGLTVRLEVSGFFDQRGTRFPAREARPNSFTGEGEEFEFESKKLGNRRSIRVWFPPGYAAGKAGGQRFPVLYMHDGQNLFDRRASAFDMEWQVDEVLGSAIEAGSLPPWLVVGIDNIGAQRAAEYNPSGLDVRGSTGRGSDYLAFLCDELMPAIAERYPVAVGPENTALGGSSFGGNITILALLERPGVFGRALIESPALWVGQGVLVERCERFKGKLPKRLFLGMGGAEYGDAARDKELIQRARKLASALDATEDDPKSLHRLWIEPEGNHNERAWARRLPVALDLVLGPAPKSGARTPPEKQPNAPLR